MKGNILKRLETVENEVKAGKKIPFLYFKYPVFIGGNRDSAAEETRAQAALQKKLDELSLEHGRKITEDDFELIVGIRQFFGKEKAEVSA